MEHSFRYRQSTSDVCLGLNVFAEAMTVWAHIPHHNLLDQGLVILDIELILLKSVIKIDRKARHREIELEWSGGVCAERTDPQIHHSVEYLCK